VLISFDEMKFEEYKYKKEQLLLDKNPVKLVRLKKSNTPVIL
jgi:hypothetical protein